MAEFSGQHIEDEYVLRFGTACIRCERELKMSFLLGTGNVAQILTLGWGPICKRCAWNIWNRLDNLPYPHDDDDEVYA